MKRFNPDMEVVRFGAEDIIVTSGAADMVLDSLMGDGIKANGTVTFDGVPYLMNNDGSVINLLDAIGAKYKYDAYQMEIDCDDNDSNLQGLLWREVYEGVGSQWVGSYTYDANSKKFNKQ